MKQNVSQKYDSCELSEREPMTVRGLILTLCIPLLEDKAIHILQLTGIIYGLFIRKLREIDVFVKF